MNYEVVKLEEQIVVGKNIDTTYKNDQCNQDVAKVWKAFLEGGIYPSIKNKTDQKPIGLYYNQKMNDGVIDFSFMT